MPAGLRRRLLAWYDRHARQLPWRRSRDPYRVWLSEIMLQQTQVETVKAYFERFVKALPTIEALAQADEHEVLRLWEGLGYYRRARQLHRAARIIVAEHGGRFPRDPQIVRRLPGIGRYTAGAILSIAFDAREPILEANTLRLLEPAARLRRRSPLGRRPAAALGDGRGRAAAARCRTVQPGADGVGQRVCTPRTPRCEVCPLATLVPGQPAGAAIGSSAAHAKACGAGDPRGGRVGSSSRPRAALALARGPPLGGAVGLPAISHSQRHAGGSSPRTGGKRSNADRRNHRAGPARHDTHARRDAIPHYAGLLRGRLYLVQPQEAVRGSNTLAPTGGVGRLPTEQHGPKARKSHATKLTAEDAEK